jgi:hypothetical protein
MRLRGCGSIAGRSPGDVARTVGGGPILAEIPARSRPILRLIRPITDQRRPSDWVQWNVESSEVTIDPQSNFRFPIAIPIQVGPTP